MKIQIRQHRDDTEMYELWQIVNGKPKYLMAVAFCDSLDKDVLPGTYRETRLDCNLTPDLPK